MLAILENIGFLGGISETLEGIIDIDAYLQQGYDFLLGLGYLEKLIGILLGGIIVILGIFSLIKKLSKIIIVIGIIVGLIFVYNNFL